MDLALLDSAVVGKVVGDLAEALDDFQGTLPLDVLASLAWALASAYPLVDLRDDRPLVACQVGTGPSSLGFAGKPFS